MEFLKIIQEGYKIHILKDNYFLNVYIKSENKKGISFKPLRIAFKDIYKEYLLNFVDLNKNINDKKIKIELEEVFDINKLYIRYLNFKLLQKNSNEENEIISKKIYALNIEYYLTEGFSHKRINSHPFISFIKKDYFNIGDIIDFISEEDLLQKYGFDEYKYFNNKLGCFIDIKDEHIKMEEKLILEFHISERKNIIRNILRQVNKYFDEEIPKIINRMNYCMDITAKYDLIFLYASPIIKNEHYEESKAPISYMDEIRKIIKLMNNNKKN